MEITPNKRKLAGLVERAQSGELCLPNFQRDFVWTREEVADLLRSILRRYFVGSLLMLRCDPDRPPFAPTPLRGASPAMVTPLPEWLILDGQQRLTALLYALTAPEGLGLKNSKRPRWFYVDLDALIADPDSDDIVFDRTERERGRDRLDANEGQWRQHKLPCTVLLRQKDFLTWRDGLDDWLREHSPEDHARFRDEWRDAWTTAIGAFHEFEAPVVELPRIDEDDADSVARICAIFEKLNSTGVDLSVYDLLTARLYRDGIELHRLWDEANETHQLLAKWSEANADTHKFGVLLLRTLALLRDLDPKPRILINLAPKNFEADWRRAAKAMERALELASHVGDDGFGVFDEKWLPGYGLLPVLAALRAEIEDRSLGDEARADLRRWYWCNVFLERYSSSVETKSRRDYAELLRYWAGGDVPSVIAEAQARIGAPQYTIRDSASHASAVYSGIFCLLAINGARDWGRAEAIALQKLEDHHIFPRNYLISNGWKSTTEKAVINSVVNRTLISDETNRIIRDRAPSDYLTDPRVFPSDPADLLDPHFVPTPALSAMQSAAADPGRSELAPVFDAFRDAREAAIVTRIREVCGVEASAVEPDPDLLEED